MQAKFTNHLLIKTFKLNIFMADIQLLFTNCGTVIELVIYKFETTLCKANIMYFFFNIGGASESR